jgi:hypothetical protein
MSLARVLGRPIRFTRIALGCALITGLTTAFLPLQDSNFDLEGTIVRQSAGKLTVDSGQGIIFHVTYDDKAAIVRSDGSAGSEKDFNAGVKVHVTGELQSSGEVKAQRIEIEGNRPAPSGESPKPSMNLRANVAEPTLI